MSWRKAALRAWTQHLRRKLKPAWLTWRKSCSRRAAMRALMSDVMQSGSCRMGSRSRLNSASAGNAIDARSS